jgi:hypothetical protein
LDPPTSSSLAEEERLGSLHLRPAARDSRRSQQFLELLAHRALWIRRRRRRLPRKNASAPSSSDPAARDSRRSQLTDHLQLITAGYTRAVCRV